MTSANRLVLALSFFASGSLQLAAAPPAVGEKAPDFSLSTMQGRQVRLSEVTAQSPVVLVVLRGYPGYQCPYCTRQVQDFVANAERFGQAGVNVVFVYPGPPDDLAGKAAESAAGKPLPERFTMLLDPGYEFTSLRWDAPKEAAYPSRSARGTQAALRRLKSRKRWRSIKPDNDVARPASVDLVHGLPPSGGRRLA